MAHVKAVSQAHSFLYNLVLPNYAYFLLQDKSEFVRRGFVEKLREKLMQWKQQRYGLPSTFLAYFVLAGLEQDEDVKSSMLHALKLCVQDKRQQVWSLINYTRGLILIIPKMAYLGAISQQIIHCSVSVYFIFI